jgi:DNA polymerase-3 subunit gamma/tau
MAYQVLARKWRPQRFDDVVGQQAVTRTLRNAIQSGRLAQAFVFAGPRGVGKTTTARILARALNCVSGPTPTPCGACDACVEIAEGRDMDVLEIDAATHTQVDNVREVIISGLAIAPVRDRYKIFIIDEVHQLSNASFNALLKSIEEPPPHVVFMMATTELEKIPETVRSRSQIHELRTIAAATIARTLRAIVDAEGIGVSDESLQLIARDADGSMRDAESKLDQVIAFTGSTIGPDDVSTVLGLVGRDLVLDAVLAVADEDASAAFTVAGRAVEMGYDLRLVCRELSRVVRDLLVLSVDPSRATDPEIAGETERDRLLGLAKRFSREDLLRAFDVLTKAETDIRTASEPRHHLELALLRWIYLRKLVPIEDLIQQAGSTAPGAVAPQVRRDLALRPAQPSPIIGRPAAGRQADTSNGPERPAAGVSSTAARSAASPIDPTLSSTGATSARSADRGPSVAPQPTGTNMGVLKDALLSEIRKSKAVFYNTVVAQAQAIDVSADRVSFTFATHQRSIREMFDQNRAWVEAIVERLAGRKIAIGSVLLESGVGLPLDHPTDARETPTEASETGTTAETVRGAPTGKSGGNGGADDRRAALRQRALADAGVQALLEVFPAEIRDVEEV